MQPGLRVPLTTDPRLFAEAVMLGRLVALEGPQADLMERILNGELIKLAHIRKELDEGEAVAAASK